MPVLDVVGTNNWRCGFATVQQIGDRVIIGGDESISIKDFCIIAEKVGAQPSMGSDGGFVKVGVNRGPLCGVAKLEIDRDTRVVRLGGRAYCADSWRAFSTSLRGDFLDSL